jgi:transcriptional regulator with XRE-family HTH domain
MTQESNRTGPSREWLRKMAEIEDTCPSVSVGGMACELDMLGPAHSNMQPIFGRFVEFARRQLGMSVEQLANAADIELSEIVEIEMHDANIPRVRTVFQLAKALKIPEGRLMEVAGLVTPRPETSHAALKFAARSEPTSKLTVIQREALEEFVKVLVEVSDGGMSD